MNDGMEGKMSDFGISKLKSTNTGHDHQLATKLIGSIGYLDPEYVTISFSHIWKKRYKLHGFLDTD